MKSGLLLFLGLLLLAACQSPSEEPKILVSLIADGRERTFEYSAPVTVQEFLQDAEIELGERDRFTPERFVQITDGMHVTVVRVREETQCEQEEIPYERQVVPNEGLEPGVEQLAQSGQNGTQEVCYRTIIEDEVPQESVRVGQPTIIQEPQPEVIYVGLENELEPISIVGTLAYINNNNAWVIQGNTTTKKPLTTASDLDSLVFSLSDNGERLLYTTSVTNDEGTFLNQLWTIETSGNQAPLQLAPTDVLYADWVPQQDNLISYSTAETQSIAPFWKALNNLWLMEIEPASGQALNIEELVSESTGGLNGWWGTHFDWSPDGEFLAWSRADSIGLVDIETGELEPILNYALFNTSQPWSWRADISWSWDSNLILTTVHGQPLGSERPENSPVFNVAVTDLSGSFLATVVDSAGMWSAPKYSPQTNATSSEFPQGYLAYLRAREPYKSISGEYDLVLADRDGSNQRVVFPEATQPGIKTSDFGLTAQDFTWSPDGRQIALIYQSNLWVVDVETGVSHQLTFDSGASNPVWTQ